jgi:hypothetical protein
MTVVPPSPPPCGGTSNLTDADRALIDRARTLARLDGAGIRRYTRERDPGLALAAIVGECQHTLRELAERLAGGPS